MRNDDRLAAVQARLRESVAPRKGATDDQYRWLRYQLGWADEHGNPDDARRGKGIRPLLCLTATSAVGGQWAQAVDVAAAIELTHEFSLVHDDIEDRDELRRGRPTLWTLVGDAVAINAGDALFALARSLLSSAELPAPIVVRLSRRYDEACLLLSEGQHMDLAFEQTARISVADYVDMVSRKTGALLSAAASMGALCGGADDGVASRFADYGSALGIAFQMADDVLGLWGDSQRTGKPVGRDLERRKKTYPIVRALEDPKLGEELGELLGASDTDPERARLMAVKMEEAGYRSLTAEEAGRWAEGAAASLAPLTLEDAARAELAGLLRRAVDRDM
jgi:geranylgeranyl diphosphate synthase type I